MFQKYFFRRMHIGLLISLALVPGCASTVTRGGLPQIDQPICREMANTKPVSLWVQRFQKISKNEFFLVQEPKFEKLVLQVFERSGCFSKVASFPVFDRARRKAADDADLEDQLIKQVPRSTDGSTIALIYTATKNEAPWDGFLGVLQVLSLSILPIPRSETLSVACRIWTPANGMHRLVFTNRATRWTSNLFELVPDATSVADFRGAGEPAGPFYANDVRELLRQVIQSGSI